MKIQFILPALLWLAVARAVPAAEDLTATLQKGLFEEEANHNFAAAIQAYHSLATRADEQRKLAATAVFRLGECHRKLGQTNEAVAQYERLLRDFSDQTPLVTLSRQNLAGLGAAAQPRSRERFSGTGAAEQRRLLGEEIKLVEGELRELEKRLEVGNIGLSVKVAKQRELLQLQRELAALDDSTEGAAAPEQAIDTNQKQMQLTFLEQRISEIESEVRVDERNYEDIRRMSDVQDIKAFSTFLPDNLLNKLLEQLTAAEQKLAEVKETYAGDHPEVKRARVQVEIITKQLFERRDSMAGGFRLKADAARDRLMVILKQREELKQSLNETRTPEARKKVEIREPK